MQYIKHTFSLQQTLQTGFEAQRRAYLVSTVSTSACIGCVSLSSAEIRCVAMSALGRAANRLQHVIGSPLCIRSAASDLHLVPDPTPPAAAPGSIVQRQAHGIAEPHGAVRWHTSSSFSMPHRATSLRGQCADIDVSAPTLASAQLAGRCSASASRLFSAAAARLRNAATNWSCQSGQVAAQQRHSSSAAFVTEHGGGTFRSTVIGSESSSTTSAASGAQCLPFASLLLPIAPGAQLHGWHMLCHATALRTPCRADAVSIKMLARLLQSTDVPMPTAGGQSGAGFDSGAYGTAFAEEEEEPAKEDGRRCQILEAALKHVVRLHDCRTLEP